MNNDIILNLSNVGLSYKRRTGFFKSRRFWALKDVSFRLLHGETLGVIGRNGAGKSTLLKLLAGIIAPDRGNIDNYGATVSLLSLQVGFMKDLTGRENAVLSGLLLGMHRQDIEALLPEIIEFSELQDFIDEPVGTYSTGMKARLGFAVAFHADPDVLLVDEVLGVGDAAFKAKSTEAMREKIRSNKTVVLVSHNADTIVDLCDRAVWIENGRTMAEGAPADVIDQYHASIHRQPKNR